MHREIRCCKTIPLASDLRQQKICLVLWDMLSSLKHHMFDYVRQPGMTRLLVAKSCTVENTDDCEWLSVILLNDQLQPICQTINLVSGIEQRFRTNRRWRDG